MNRMLVSNLSQRLGWITKCFNCNRTFVRACETRRNQYQELPLTANVILDIIYMTKGVLRVKIPVVKVTVGLPKSRKRYGNGGLILAATKNMCFSNTSKVMFRECEVIQRRELTTSNLGMGHKKLIQNLNNKFYYDKICNTKKLMQAYEFVTKNKVNNTKDVDFEILDGYSKDAIYSISKSLKDHSFKFKPIRLIEIPKPNGSTQKLGIPSLRDKVILKVMVMALEEIYKTKFLTSSHGFKPKRGTHSALKSVASWNDTKWFIEGDIFKCFDTLDHHILEQLLKKEIFSKPFIDLYWKAVKSHYISPVNKVKESSNVVVPQGNILSPMFLNIYLHELDKFMQIKMEESKKGGSTSKNSPKYKRVHTKILNIHYVRYADNFLIGINGPRRIAEELRQELQTFLLNTLKLTLNSEKTKITRSDQGVYFLGAKLKCYVSRVKDQNRRINSITKTKRKIRAKMVQGRIIALAPLDHLIQKLQSQGFCKIRNLRKHDVIPTSKTAWINLDLATIIKKYNNVWRGLLNYYSFAYNRSQLNYIQYLLHHSLACTFMNKLKLNSRRQVFKKYGKTIQIQNDNGKLIAFKLEKSLSRIEKFSNNVLPSGFEMF